MPTTIDELRRRAEAAARQLDEKYEIRSKIGKGTRATTDALRKGAEAATAGLDAAREEAARIDREHKVSEKVAEGARRAAAAADDALKRTGAKKKVADAASAAKEKAADIAGSAKAAASDVYGEARRYYETASDAARAGVSAAKLPAAVIGAVSSARDWVKNNPGKAAVVSLALIAGTRAGSAFSALDVAVLGAGGAGSWLFHSAVVPYGLRKLSDKYEVYLKKQEGLMREGKLTDTELERVKFQRDVARYVGAPLLGAFSVAAGAGLVYEAFTGGVVTGFPLSLVLGPNALLSSIWLFGSGLVCFHSGYKFFMMALADQEDVARVVREIKGLLPAAAVSSS